MIVNQVLLFEYISGGGMGNSADFEFLISEGFGMLSSLISDFLRLGFGIQVLIDERVVKRFTQKFNNEIQDQKIRFVVISNEKELPTGLEMLIPSSDFILLIAPEFSNILMDISALVEAQLHSHQVLLNLPAKAISIFSDKLKSEQYIRSIGYSTPRSTKISMKSTMPFTTYENCILKPFDGVGSADTFWVSEQNEIARNVKISAIIEKFPQHKYILQEKIHGNPLSAFIACNKGKITYFTINFQTIQFLPFDQNENIQKLEYLGGYTPFTKISPEIKSTILNLAETICSQFQLTGFMGIDFMYDDSCNQYSVVDINPRVTTPYIAISALFKENHDNVVRCLFSDRYVKQISGMKSYRKSNKNEIVLN